LHSPLKLIIALSVLLTTFSVFAQDTLWVRRLDTDSNEVANGIACQGDEIVAVGYRLGTTNNDWLVVKYNQLGETLWTTTFDYGFDDMAFDASFDSARNIFVTGTSYQFADLPESKAPKLLKGRRFYPPQNINRRDQELYALTIKYDSAGQIKWQRAEVNKSAGTIATDNNGSSYVSGFYYDGYNMDIWVEKYNSVGESLWSKTLSFSLYDEGNQLGIDKEGNIILAAHTGYDNISDCVLIKLLPNGDTVWTQRYDLNPWDNIVGLAVDQQNNIIVAGFTGSDPDYDYLILKYNSAGTLLWSTTFDRDTDDAAAGVACDENDNIFVTGSSGSNYIYDYLTIKYNPAGDTVWTAIYDNGADDAASDVVCDDAGNPIVTGSSMANNYDFLTIKYRNEVGIEEPHSTQYALRNTPVLPHSSISGSKFIFYAPSAGYFNLELYDCKGIQQKKIYHGYLNQGAHHFLLKDLASGVDFIKVDSPEGNSTVQKLVLIK